MRKRLQYAFAAAIGCILGAWIAVDGVLLGAILGAGVGMLIVLFVHVYPHVGYAEQRIDPPCRRRRFNC
jgi:hypothetical protein